MAAVLITGSSGYIGRRVVAELQRRGYDVHGLDVYIDPSGGYQQHQDDLSSLDRLQRLLSESAVTAIVHGGGISGPSVAPNNPDLIFRSNVLGSANLLEAARRADIQRLICLSSVAAIGPTERGMISDDAPLRPADMYGASKASVELMVTAYANDFQMSATSLRLPTVYGPGDSSRSFISRMVTAALGKKPFVLPWGQGYSCPYLFIDDAIMAICQALEPPILRQTAYNIAGPDCVATEEIARHVQRLVPGAQISLGCGPPLRGYERGPMDISGAKRDIGYVPAVDFALGILRTTDWLRSGSAAEGAPA